MADVVDTASVASVEFQINGRRARVENVFPYALAGTWGENEPKGEGTVGKVEVCTCEICTCLYLKSIDSKSGGGRYLLHTSSYLFLCLCSVICKVYVVASFMLQAMPKVRGNIWKSHDLIHL